jgi:hypothetical protein
MATKFGDDRGPEASCDAALTMAALVVFAQHHVHADRDIAVMATLRMLNKELTADIDSKYPGYSSDLIALKAARLEARGDAMIAAFEAAKTKTWRYSAGGYYSREYCLFQAIRNAGLLNPRKRPWDADLRPRMMAWLRDHFCTFSPLLYDIMHALKYNPVWLVRHTGPVPTLAELEICYKVMEDDLIPSGAVRAPYDLKKRQQYKRREHLYLLRVPVLSRRAFMEIIRGGQNPTLVHN